MSEWLRGVILLRGYFFGSVDGSSFLNTHRGTEANIVQKDGPDQLVVLLRSAAIYPASGPHNSYYNIITT